MCTHAENDTGSAGDVAHAFRYVAQVCLALVRSTTPPYFAKTAAVWFTASGNRCGNPSSVQRPAIFLVVVSPIGVDAAQLAQWSTMQAANRWDSVDQWKQLRDVVAVRARQEDRDRRAVRVGGEVMFGTGSCTIGGVRSNFLPVPAARKEVESMPSREKSIRSAACNFASRISWSRC